MEIAKLTLEYIKVLIWPSVVLIITCLFHSQIKSLIKRISKGELPGGVKFETFDDKIEAAKQISEEVKKENVENTKKYKEGKIPFSEANVKLINHDLKPSPSGLNLDYYRKMALEDITLSVAGLRIEIEIFIHNLAKKYQIEYKDDEFSMQIAKRLLAKSKITEHQFALGKKLNELCTAAMHGLEINLEQVNKIIKIAEILFEDYISWLSWGFIELPTPPEKQ